MINNVVYRVESKGRNKMYTGSTGGCFKDRYAGHSHTFVRLCVEVFSQGLKKANYSLEHRCHMGILMFSIVILI